MRASFTLLAVPAAAVLPTLVHNGFVMLALLQTLRYMAGSLSAIWDIGRAGLEPMVGDLLSTPNSLGQQALMPFSICLALISPPVPRGHLPWGWRSVYWSHSDYFKARLSYDMMLGMLEADPGEGIAEATAAMNAFGAVVLTGSVPILGGAQVYTGPSGETMVEYPKVGR